MRLRLITAGKPALSYARTATEEYLKRLSRYGGCDWEIVKAGSSEEVSARLLERSRGCLRVALDERGETPDTRTFASWFSDWETRGEVKAVAFLIGAADGHSAGLREACERVLSLSRLTMQHELAMVVLLEQLYRVASLRAGAPYHREG